MPILTNHTNTSNRTTLPQYAEAVMAYAFKHDYPEIMDIAAPLLLVKSLEESVTNLPPNMIVPWV